MSKPIFLSLLLLTSCAHAAGVRIRSCRDEADGCHTAWGTAFAVDRHTLATAFHVVNVGAVQVELDGKWVPAKLKASDATSDAALVTVDAKLKPVELEALDFTVEASDKSEAVTDHRAVLTEADIACPITDGNSGAPVMYRGKCVGMITARDPGGEAGHFVSAAVIEALLKRRTP